ncbi:MAG TPA: YCF48-related protein [Ignavibacteria bacterium]|nr:YCF48-related protein [Ignavibacteria bacterium]HMR41250.1 YCF48-related protein [Ignavibacteria bacterium]
MNKQKLKYEGKLIFTVMILLNIIFLSEKVLSQKIHTGAISKWYWKQPLPTGNKLNSVYFINNNTGFASGEYGTIIKTIDGGNKWSICQSVKSSDLNSIFFLNERDGYAAGNSGTILKTTDSGNNWSNVSFHSKINIYDIQFCDKLTGYASGLNGIILKSTNAGENWFALKTGSNSSLFCISFLNENTGVTGGYNVILKTTNGGTDWIGQNINSFSSGAVKGINYIDENTICAAGDLPGGAYIKTADGGNSWTMTSLGLPYLFGGSVDLVRSMSFINSNTGFIVTDFATILKTTDSGISWKRDSSFRPSYAKLSVMYDVNISSQEKISICGGGGSVFVSENSGEDWSVKSGNKRSLRDCKFADQKTGIAVGEKGEFLKSTDGGSNWVKGNSFTTKFLNTAFLINENIYYAAGDSGAIFRTSDGGIHWSDQTNYKKYDIQSIYFTDENNGMVAGGYQDGERAFIYKTTNAGVNWFEAYDSLGLGKLNSLTFVNVFSGYCAGNNGNILRTFDGGYSWESENIFSGNLYSVSFRDTKNGLISGETGMIFKTTNGGTDWDYMISGFYSDIYSVKYLSEDMAVAGGQEGTILISRNDGINWQKEFRITKSDIHSVEFNFDNKIFAAGEYGTIIYSDIKEPTLLASANKNTEIPEATLSANYPNPFNPTTTIKFDIRTPAFTKLTIFDVLGREIQTLVNEELKTGSYSLVFDGSEFNSGVYFYRLTSGDFTETKRMLMVK